MKLYWGPGVRVDWVPDGRAKWYALDELQAV
jgi:hypothetical protein